MGRLFPNFIREPVIPNWIPAAPNVSGVKRMPFSDTPIYLPSEIAVGQLNRFDAGIQFSSNGTFGQTINGLFTAFPPYGIDGAPQTNLSLGWEFRWFLLGFTDGTTPETIGTPAQGVWNAGGLTVRYADSDPCIIRGFFEVRKASTNVLHARCYFYIYLDTDPPA